MIINKKIIVVLPSYNAEKTLKITVNEIDRSIVDEIILVDDFSTDKTLEIAKKLNLKVIKHKKNLGYGGNQKTCYNEALKLNADIIIMLHPDYQYTPKLIPAMAGMIASETYDFVLGSRIIGGGALKGGMPIYKYIFNRILTLIENLLTGLKLSEFHTGFRAYSSELLKKTDFNSNSNDFIFDNQMIIKSHYLKFRIGEISCPTRYDKNSSSINFFRSVLYGFGCIKYGLLFFLIKNKMFKSQFFKSIYEDFLIYKK